MNRTYIYIIIGTAAITVITVCAYIPATMASSSENNKGENVIKIRRGIGKSREFIFRNAPMNPDKTAQANIEPIEIDGVKYEEVWYPAGTLKATDVRTGDIIWQKQVYYDKHVSSTSTPILFSSFSEEVDNKHNIMLKVVNEEGEVYRINPKTSDVDLVVSPHYAESR